ncbi:uncharacterized protein N7529_007545 [Penicillium soppii]|uniref:uncharacterized protein n=1 Tax=Penicillium soppii TaxID=69789 RepID=UPI0025473446|nr:uncharacterized protein N7529_007545 [Penicillium soppii]KAJ5860235.1 hypothetical protein N7529_007545 [Penicillium soppii]
MTSLLGEIILVLTPACWMRIFASAWRPTPIMSPPSTPSANKVSSRKADRFVFVAVVAFSSRGDFDHLLEKCPGFGAIRYV